MEHLRLSSFPRASRGDDAWHDSGYRTRGSRPGPNSRSANGPVTPVSGTAGVYFVDKLWPSSRTSRCGTVAIVLHQPTFCMLRPQFAPSASCRPHAGPVEAGERRSADPFVKSGIAVARVQKNLGATQRPRPRRTTTSVDHEFEPDDCPRAGHARLRRSTQGPAPGVCLLPFFLVSTRL